MPERDRDRSVEHVLRRVLSESVPGAPHDVCLDGETIAAWTDGSLRTEETDAVERHVADCARCRALMAAFAQTTLPEPRVESVWRRWRLGWVVPLATAATAAALWIALPPSTPAPLRSDRETNGATFDARSPAAPPATASPAVPEPSTPASPRAQEEKATTLATNEARGRADETLAPRELAAEQQAPATEALGKRAETDRQEIAGNSAPQPFAAARRANVPVEIVAPGDSARWRITNGQQVERSTPTTTDWGPAIIASPDILTAGAAPSASVCWIVGRGGAVYVTTDGTRFMRLPFPEMVDLVSVSATDDQNAAVSAADGRFWQTTDRGLTWSTGR